MEITLADLPFIRLRDTLPAELFSGKQRFTDLIAAAQAQIIQPSVQFNWALKQLRCGDKLIKMPPLQMTFYVWMLERCAKQLPPITWLAQENPSIQTQILTIYKRLYGETGHFEKIERALNLGLKKKNQR